MLFVKSINETGGIDSSSGHRNYIWLHEVDVSKVTEVQADQDELNDILSNAWGLPYSDLPVQYWYGDHAKFVVQFLKDFGFRMRSNAIRTGVQFP